MKATFLFALIVLVLSCSDADTKCKLDTYRSNSYPEVVNHVSYNSKGEVTNDVWQEGIMMLDWRLSRNGDLLTVSLRATPMNGLPAREDLIYTMRYFNELPVEVRDASSQLSARFNYAEGKLVAFIFGSDSTAVKMDERGNYIESSKYNRLPDKTYRHEITITYEYDDRGNSFKGLGLRYLNYSVPEVFFSNNNVISRTNRNFNVPEVNKIKYNSYGYPSGSPMYYYGATYKCNDYLLQDRLQHLN